MFNSGARELPELKVFLKERVAAVSLLMPKANAPAAGGSKGLQLSDFDFRKLTEGQA